MRPLSSPAMRVFLDLDGPILDNRRRYYALYRDLLSPHGCRLLSAADYWARKRRRVRERDIALETCPPELVDPYVSERLRRIEDLDYLLLDCVWDGVPALLQDWSRRHELYLVTLRNRRATLLEQLSRFELGPYFRRLLSTDDNAGTPQVKVQLMMSEVDDPGRCVMIGDTEADLEAGRALGVPTIAVTCGIRDADLLAAAGPVRLCADLLQVDLDELRAAG